MVCEFLSAVKKFLFSRVAVCAPGTSRWCSRITAFGCSVHYYMYTFSDSYTVPGACGDILLDLEVYTPGGYMAYCHLSSHFNSVQLVDLLGVIKY